MVAYTLLNVTLHIHCLSCYNCYSKFVRASLFGRPLYSEFFSTSLSGSDILVLEHRQPVLSLKQELS